MLCPQKVISSLDLGIFHRTFPFHGSLLKLILEVYFFFVTRILLAETCCLMLYFLKPENSTFLIFSYIQILNTALFCRCYSFKSLGQLYVRVLLLESLMLKCRLLSIHYYVGLLQESVD